MGERIVASVIIPCHRTDDVLPLQLEALARQMDAPPFEVLLVDNGRNGALHENAASFAHLLPNLRIVPAGSRRGAGYARNVGMGAAKGRFLLFCDADDVVMPEWVLLGVRQLERTSVFSGGAVPVGEALCAAGWSAVVEHVGPHEDVDGPLQLSGTHCYPILMGGSFGIRREVALQLGGFDLSFGSAAEDNDLAFRIVKAGLEIPDAGQACIAYRIRDESGGFLRGVRAGVAHGLLCARHDAWRHSPSYRGRWVLRLAKGALLLPIRMAKAQEAQRASVKDAFGRQVGCFLGWLRYRAGLAVPPPELGVGIEEGSSQ